MNHKTRIRPMHYLALTRDSKTGEWVVQPFTGLLGVPKVHDGKEYSWLTGPYGSWKDCIAEAKRRVKFGNENQMPSRLGVRIILGNHELTIAE